MSGFVKESILRMCLLTVLGVGLGVVLILVSPSALLWLASVLLGIGIVISVLPELIHEVQYYGEEPTSDLVGTIFVLLLGLLLIFCHHWVAILVVGILLIVIPCWKIATALSKKDMFLNQLPVLIFGVILLVVGPAKFLGILFDIAGWAIIVLTVFQLVYAIVILVKAKPVIIQHSKTEIFEDRQDGEHS